ncbi:MAG: carbon-nitrogen hydrolase family protein [Planctomycetia bacterium]|nr:carbon-nitrogen hydrolase family protein [Planctomycetia bacterium]
MLDVVRVAAAAADTQLGQVQLNLEKIKLWVGRAADEGAQVVLLPELSLSGFIPNHPSGHHESWLRRSLAEARRSAIALTSGPVNALRRIAGEHRLLISAGILEDAGNLLFNTQLLVGPDGLLGYWRKMHVPMFEMPFYNGGGGPQVIETPLGRIGANICFDAMLPESTRLLAVQNVEIVLFPFAADPPPRTPSGWAQWAGPAIRARCQENGVFGVACNYVGRVECAGVTQDFPGGGLISSPRGELLAQWNAESGQSGLMLADLTALDLQSARAEPEYLYRFRRPELYGPLAEPNSS